MPFKKDPAKISVHNPGAYRTVRQHQISLTAHRLALRCGLMSEAEQSFPVPDLSHLESDLAKSLQPSWATKQASPGDGERMAGRFGGKQDRPLRKGGEGRRHPSFGRGTQGERSPRGSETRREHSGRQERSGKRNPRGGTSRSPDRQEAVRKPSELSGWELHFIADPRGIDGIASQIKATAKAYALFDLARLVLERPERFLVRFRKKNEDAVPLWILATDGTLWKSRREAETHALAAHAGQFFRIEKSKGEHPKGNYAFVAQCSLSGEILGPPNHHEYQANLRALHAARFSHMPFETYKSKVRMLRDEESIQHWRDSKSLLFEYFPLSAEPQSVPEPPVCTEPISEQAGSTVPPEEGPAAASDLEATSQPKGMSAEEAKLYFQSQFSPAVISELPDGALVSGSVASSASDPCVTSAVHDARLQLNRFPLPLAHEMGSQLQSRGLHVFKSPQKVLHISVARPRPLLSGDSSLADGVRQILEALRAHPHMTRREQWKAVLASRPIPEGKSEEEVKNALAADFAWLLREGHIIDYASGGLVIP